MTREAAINYAIRRAKRDGKAWLVYRDDASDEEPGHEFYAAREDSDAEMYFGGEPVFDTRDCRYRFE